jgi:hypothetical protein
VKSGYWCIPSLVGFRSGCVIASGGALHPGGVHIAKHASFPSSTRFLHLLLPSLLFLFRLFVCSLSSSAATRTKKRSSRTSPSAHPCGTAQWPSTLEAIRTHARASGTATEAKKKSVTEAQRSNTRTHDVIQEPPKREKSMHARTSARRE